MDPGRPDISFSGALGTQLGSGNVQFNLFPGTGAPMRSSYLERVRRIAPPELVGRDEELAELARFCLADDGAPYAWWQAGAWAGKSALFSAFVLRPPPEVAARGRVVSF